MVPVWSWNQHLRRGMSCFPLALASQTHQRPSELLYCACRKHCLQYFHKRTACSISSMVLLKCRLWNILPYHKDISVSEVDGKKSDAIWKQQFTCLATHSQSHAQNNQGGSGWEIFSVENRHFYNTLRKNESYQKYFTATIEGKKWPEFYTEMITRSKRLIHFVDQFENFCMAAVKYNTFSTGLKQSEPKLAKLNGQFSKLISELKTNEILCLVRKFDKVVRHFNHKDIYFAFKLLLCSASQELKKRVEIMTPEELFRVADLLYVTGFHRDNIMVKAVIQRCMSNPDLLEVPEQHILFLFYLGLERLSRRGVTLETGDQDKMAVQLGTCNIDEIGIAALGLFRAEIQLKSEKMGLLVINKLEENLHSSHPITLSAILKFILHTADRRLSEKFPSINEALTNRDFTCQIATSVSRSTKRDIPWIMRICRLYSSIRFCPEEVFQMVVHKVSEIGTSQIRLKDIAEFVMRFSSFAYSGKGTQELYNMLKEELLQRETSLEFEIYTVCLAKCIIGFVEMDIFPYQLIQLLFNESRLTKFGDKKFYFSRLPYMISESVKLERPDYGGPLLPKIYSERIPEQGWYRQELEHAHMKSQMRDPTLRAMFTSALEEALEMYLGDRGYFLTHMFLPHFFSFDIGFAVNEHGVVIPVRDWCTSEGHIKKQSTYTKVMIVPLLERDALYTYMDQEGNRSQRMVSKITMKFRQLRLLGFNVVHIFQNEFTECHNQQELLDEKLSPFVNKPAEKVETKLKNET